MVEKEYLLSRILSYYKKLKSEKRVNFRILNLINFFDFAIDYKDDLVKITNIKETLTSMIECLADINDNIYIHQNLKYLLNDRVNKYNEVYF